MSTAVLKLTPLYPMAQGLGAQFVERGGWRIPEIYTSVEAEVEAARQGVALADDTPRGKLMVQGQGAEAVLQAAFELPALAVGEGAAMESGCVYRLRNDLFFISTPSGEEEAAQEKLTGVVQESGAFITVVDTTHGCAEIRVLGPASRALLSKVCGLDFDAAIFPDGAARQSSVAKTTQLIIRRDTSSLPGFCLIGKRSLSAYLWETMAQAGREWGVVPLGRAALDALEEKL